MLDANITCLVRGFTPTPFANGISVTRTEVSPVSGLYTSRRPVASADRNELEKELNVSPRRVVYTAGAMLPESVK